MSAVPSPVISPREALKRLGRDGVLLDVRVSGPLDLRSICDGDRMVRALRFERVALAGISAACVQFARPVDFRDCTIEDADFFAAYFLGGLLISSCRFAGPCNFECGGHNQGGSVVRIADTVFEEFVNFFDCWYEGPVEVHRCSFRGGTNLLGNKGEPFVVQFDAPPSLVGNAGTIDADGG